MPCGVGGVGRPHLKPLHHGERAWGLPGKEPLFWAPVTVSISSCSCGLECACAKALWPRPAGTETPMSEARLGRWSFLAEPGLGEGPLPAEAGRVLGHRGAVPRRCPACRLLHAVTELMLWERPHQAVGSCSLSFVCGEKRALGEAVLGVGVPDPEKTHANFSLLGARAF